jgi:hypothetical protein
MSSRHLLIVSMAALFITAPALVSGAEQPDPLKHEMQAMGRDYKTLRGQIDDASKNASSLTVVADLEKHALAAKLMTPPLVAHSPAAEQPKMMIEFRTQIAKLLQQELQLEQDLLANDNAKAADTLNKIHETEEQGHHEFRKRR